MIFVVLALIKHMYQSIKEETISWTQPKIVRTRKTDKITRIYMKKRKTTLKNLNIQKQKIYQIYQSTVEMTK